MLNTQSTVTRPQFSRRTAWRLGVLAACSLLVLSAASVSARADVAGACSCSSHLECQATGRGDYCSYAPAGGSGGACTPRMKPDVTLTAVAPYDQQFPNGVLVCSGPAGSPSCDGVCRSSREPRTSYRSLRPSKLAHVADLLLQAYIKSGSAQGGAPDPALVDQARQAAMNFSPGWQKEILASVHNVLMTVLGGDFIPPQDGAFFGQIPKLTPESLALVQGVSQAFVEGLRNGDPTPVKNAVYDFFNNNAFAPRHAAHCYPDGVSQVEDVQGCIAGELSGMTNVLIQGQDEACTEGGPDCQNEPPACDPNTEDCSDGEPPACDPNQQDCSGGEPPACDPNQQDCSGGEPPACDPNQQDCSGGEPPACDPNMQDCSGGEPPACDPNMQDCSGGEPPACDPNQQDCGGGEPPACDPNMQDCSGGEPPACDPNMQDCSGGEPPACDPNMQDCSGGEPPACDPNQQDCGGGEPPACDPNQQDCGGGEPPACDPNQQDCGGGEPPACDPNQQDCGGSEPPACDPNQQDCGGGEPPACDPNQQDCGGGEPPACDPNQQDCSGGEPPACDPNQQDCSGGEPPACDPNQQDCGGGEPPACDPSHEDCSQAGANPGQVHSGGRTVRGANKGGRTHRIPWTHGPGFRSGRHR